MDGDQLRYQLARFQVVTSQPEMSGVRLLMAAPTTVRDRTGRMTLASQKISLTLISSAARLTGSSSFWAAL